jgi:hypothetical protein
MTATELINTRGRVIGDEGEDGTGRDQQVAIPSDLRTRQLDLSQRVPAMQVRAILPQQRLDVQQCQARVWSLVTKSGHGRRSIYAKALESVRFEGH